MRSVAGIFFTVMISVMPAGLVVRSGAEALNLPLRVQASVREGDFAIGLVGALDIRTAKSEADAMGLLVAYGIEPENGWIPNHPLTFKILNEVEEAVRAAAETRELPMGEEAAVEQLAVRTGLPVMLETSFQTAAQMLPKPGEYNIAPQSPAPSPQAVLPPSSSPSPLPPKPGGPSTIAPEKGAFNPRTGDFYPGTFGGAYNPRTGDFYPKTDGGYLDYRNGTLLPEKK